MLETKGWGKAHEVIYGKQVGGPYS